MSESPVSPSEKLFNKASLLKTPGLHQAWCGLQRLPRPALPSVRPPHRARRGLSGRRVPERPGPGQTTDYPPGVPSSGWKARSEPAHYLQQVQLGHEAPRQVEEAVASVGEGHSHGRLASPGTRQAFATPHHLQTRSLPPSPPHLPTLAHPGQPGRPRASEPDEIDRPRPLRPPPSAPSPRRVSPRAGWRRSKHVSSHSPGPCAAPLGGGTAVTDSSFAGNDGRRCRLLSQSRHVLTHSSLLLDKLECNEADVVISARPEAGKMASDGGELGGSFGHHVQRAVCDTRAKYREGRRPRAVKVR